MQKYIMIHEFKKYKKEKENAILQIKHDTATKTKTLFVDSVCLSF
jgi:hypothetical protein